MTEKITSKNYDVVFKEALTRYKDEMIEFLGLDVPEVIDIEPTELPEIEEHVNNTDFIYKLADNSLLHFEFQSEYDREDIKRFMLYDTRLYNDCTAKSRYARPAGQISFWFSRFCFLRKLQKYLFAVIPYNREEKKIKTVIVCKKSNKKKEKINGGTFKYEVEIKSLKGYRAEEVLEKKDVKEVELIFIPLMDSKMSTSERIKKAIEKYKEIEKDERKVIDFTATLLVMANRVITREEFREIWEGIKMLNIIRYAEEIGMEKGMEKGMKKGIEKGIEMGLDIKFGEIGMRIMDNIKKIHDITKLEAIKEAIRKAKTIDDVVKVM